MTDHLSDQQLDAVLLGDATASATEHLKRCAECCLELERLRVELAGMRADEQVRAERTDFFWREQRASIAAQIPAGLEITTRPLAWAGSFAIFALLAVWMTHTPAPVNPPAGRAQTPANITVPADPDHDLLVDIQRSVRRDVPRALEPATLLAQELHAAANRKSDR